MQVNYPQLPSSQDWEGVFGVSREHIVTSVLKDNWFTHPSQDSLLAVTELRGADFALGFTLFANGEDAPSILKRNHIDDRGDVRSGRVGQPMLSQFDLLFNHLGNSRRVDLHDVFFDLHTSSGIKGTGTQFLHHSVRTCVELDCDLVSVEPGMFEGAAYWLHRGALLQEWPKDYEGKCALRQKIEDVLERRYDLTRFLEDKDIEELRTIYKDKDFRGLNRFLARDDLFVWRMPDKISMHRYLLYCLQLKPCIFDLNDDLTKAPLLKYVGIDVDAERVKVEVPQRHLLVAHNQSVMRATL
jgi:hypothetical protein